VSITLLEALSADRHKLTNAQNPVQLQKAAAFCNTIRSKADIEYRLLPEAKLTAIRVARGSIFSK